MMMGETMKTPNAAQTEPQDVGDGMLRGWVVTDGECHILCRAATRGTARTFWPDYDRSDRDSFLTLRVRRAPWLDGPGPAREIRGVYDACAGPYDAYGECIAGHGCYEGEYLNRELTLARLREEEGRANLLALFDRERE